MMVAGDDTGFMTMCRSGGDGRGILFGGWQSWTVPAVWMVRPARWLIPLLVPPPGQPPSAKKQRVRRPVMLGMLWGNLLAAVGGVGKMYSA